VRGNKTDRTDARGILQAGCNADLIPVPIKSFDQQQLASVHRFRAGWMGERTRRLNAVRGHLRELGIFIPVGANNVVPAARAAIEDATLRSPTLSSTRHHNKVAIAVANKLTRIVWAVWTNGRPYDKLHSRAA